MLQSDQVATDYPMPVSQCLWSGYSTSGLFIATSDLQTRFLSGSLGGGEVDGTKLATCLVVEGIHLHDTVTSNNIVLSLTNITQLQNGTRSRSRAESGAYPLVTPTPV